MLFYLHSYTAHDYPGCFNLERGRSATKLLQDNSASHKNATVATCTLVLMRNGF